MKFNPLTDLTVSQRDTAVKQLGGITGTEIGNLASSLRTASQRTSQIVDVLRRDNTKTNSDLNKIMDLDRRLKRVIPIIPEKFGEAGNIFPDRQPIPEGGIRLPRLPKFPKIPPVGGPIKVPDGKPVDVPDPVDVPETEPQREPRRRPQWQWPQLPPIPLPPRLPDFEGLPGLAFRQSTEIIASADKKLTDLGKNLDKFLTEKPGTAMGIDLAMGGFGMTARGIVAISPLLLRGLGPRAQLFLQRAFSEAPRYTPVAPITSTSGRQIGPQAAPLVLPKPPPITAAKVAPKTAAIPSQLSVPYGEILKGVSYGTREGAPIGGTTVRRRAPLMQGFQTGELFRRGPAVTPEEQAMRQALMDIADEKILKMFDDPSNVYSQLARADVDKIVARTYKRADDIAEQIFGIKSAPAKTATTSMRVLKSPRDFMNSFMEGDVVIPSGSVADILGLNNDALRKRFGYYLLQAPPGKKEQYANFIYKISKGLGIVPGKSVNQLDDSTVKFLMRFFRPSASASTDIRPGIFQKLKDKNFIDKDRLFGEFLSLDDIKNLKDPAQIPGVPDPKLLAPGAEVLGPRSSVIGKPGTMDLASLGIDTSVEVQEIYYIVG